MRVIIKFNGGAGAILCHKCGRIIKENLTKEEIDGRTDLMYCDKCDRALKINKIKHELLLDKKEDFQNQMLQM
jgi:NAD-dependent SIR2 family protein deacetylase